MPFVLCSIWIASCLAKTKTYTNKKLQKSFFVGPFTPSVINKVLSEARKKNPTRTNVQGGSFFEVSLNQETIHFEYMARRLGK